MNEPAKIDAETAQTTERARRQRLRNYAVFGALLLFVVLVYATTIVKIKMVGAP